MPWEKEKGEKEKREKGLKTKEWQQSEEKQIILLNKISEYKIMRECPKTECLTLVLK